MTIRSRLFNLAILLAMLLSAGALCAAQQPAGRRQVLSNPGFENGTSGWELGSIAAENQIAVVEDQIHGGTRSLKLSAAKPDQNMIVTSEWFAVTPDAGLDGDVWVKTADVKSGAAGPGRGGRQRGGGGLSVTIEVFGADKASQLMTLRLGGSGESTDRWSRYQAQTLLSKNCAWARYRISFTNATGIVWIDDAAANYLPTPTPDVNSSVQPAILPGPWLLKRGSEKFVLAEARIITPSSDNRLRAAVKAWLTPLGVDQHFSDSEAQDASTVLLQFGDATDREILSQFHTRFPGHDFSELGDEGYFLSVQQQRPNGAVVYAAANTEQGRFYALQTLRQLTVDKMLYAADVLDRPTMKQRGIVMSAKRFSEAGILERMAASKMNTSWSQGGFVDDKFKQKWREPFTSEELATLKAFIDKANANFITAWMAFGPRGDFDHRAQPNLARPHPGEVQYSSDKDIDTVVAKMEQLYQIGLRNFGINYDDLQNYGEQTLIGADRERFGADTIALAKANAFFLSQIIARLRERHPGDDLKFMTVPYSYWFPSRGRGAGYLKTLADGLPADVEMITCSYTDADILAMKELTARPTVVWHNYFVEDAKTSAHRLTNTEYGPPFFALYTWTDPAIRASMSGLINLMPQPGETPEDAARTSWRTAGDWQWAPDRYDPLVSFQAAVAQYRLANAARGGN